MPDAESWYANFFTGLIVDAQRTIAAASPTDAEVEFILKELDPPPGGRIADVPCGNGRLAIALAEKGYAVTGVDISDGLLADAKQAAAEKKLRATFERRDMRDLPWESELDGAFCFGNSFAYFDDAGNRDFLKAVYRSLKPGGRFVLETHFVTENIVPMPMGRKWYPFGAMYFLHETGYDPFTARQTSSYTLIKDGTVERKTAVYRVYTVRQLLDLFAEVGFAVDQVYGSLQREPFALGSPGFWVAASRRSPARTSRRRTPRPRGTSTTSAWRRRLPGAST